ncbi:MAG: phosphoribosylformylglycinamidine synthase subunit PurQ, partial [Rhodospirillaceae bacterium]
RYCDARGHVGEEVNPNGSRDNIAGILSADRRILGMMPHPENHVDPLQGGTDGQPLFLSVVESLS